MLIQDGVKGSWLAGRMESGIQHRLLGANGVCMKPPSDADFGAFVYSFTFESLSVELLLTIKTGFWIAQGREEWLQSKPGDC